MMPYINKKQSKIIDTFYNEVMEWCFFDAETETLYLSSDAPDDIKKKHDEYNKVSRELTEWCLNFDPYYSNARN